MKTDKHYGIVASSKNRVRCVFCGVLIPNSNRCISQHINGAKHKENISLMSENGLVYKNHSLFCNPCKACLLEKESVTKHIESDDHANWMAAMDDLTDGEFINVDGYLSSEENNFYCDVCQCTIDCGLQNVQEHVNKFNHQKNVVEKLKPLNGIFPVDEHEVWCKICDTYIENTVQSILDHIDEDDYHSEWFLDIEDMDEDITVEKFLTCKHEVNAFCNKCQMEIICSAESIEEHITSESHLVGS